MKLTHISIFITILFLYTKADFVARNKRLYDANNKEFLIRGVNSNHIHWDNFDRNYALNSIKYIAKTGSNLIRVVWERNGNGMNITQLEKIIKELIKNEMIAMIELHDATGSKEKDDLLKCARWFRDNIELFVKYRRYVLINIANEWSPWGTSLEYSMDSILVWRDAYKSAINIVRESGWNGSLVIDASAYAQNPDGPILYGEELVQHDPVKNLIFSIHCYAEWKTDGGRNITSTLAELKKRNITFIIGEFSLNHPEGCKWIRIDVKEIMRQSKKLNIGYIGWSWHGNGKGDCNLDLSIESNSLNMVKGDAEDGCTWKSNNFTEFGKIIFNYKRYGIKSTSKKASVFI